MHITLRCNRKCAWCYQIHDEFYDCHAGDMQVDAFERILFSLKNYSRLRPHIHLFGGEPLCHPDFAEFIRIAKIYNFSPTITTNGDYLDKYLGAIENSSISQINISLNRRFHISLEETYNSLVPAVIFLRKQCRKIINFSFNLNPNEYYMLEDVVVFFNKIFKKGLVSTFTCQHYMLNNIKPGMRMETRIDPHIIKLQLQRLKNAKLNFKLLALPNILLADLDRYYSSDFSFRNKCFVPWAGLSIYPDLEVTMGGGVLSCNKTIGNLNSESIKEIWHAYALRKFRRHLLDYGLEEKCNRCCQKLYY